MLLPKIILVSALLLATPAAQATLGEPEASIDNVRRAIPRSTRSQGVRHGQGTSSYTVHEVKNDGTSVKEYVRADGTVFAVIWQGYRTPDTQVLLGKYNADLRQLQATARRARNSRGKGARAQTLSGNRLLAIRAGHPRALRGRFIDPNLIPAGVKINDIQ